MSPQARPHPLRGCLAQSSLFCLMVVFASAPFVLLPMHPCPQACCDRPNKLKRLQSIPGVSPQEAQKMLDWAEPFP
ncbi:MAG TPA: hypothetical protein VMU54_01160 [Planctomycetota bacterium]|nr:hypothetical protein [Planctomycetota bacterium]